MSSDVEAACQKTASEEAAGKDVATSVSHLSVGLVGRENLSDTLPPHESYEGRHRFNPNATWTGAEERKVVRKTDLYLLTWLCLMFFGL